MLDQSSPDGNTWYNGSSSTLNWQQEVVGGHNGLLAGIELSISPAGSINFYINKGAAR